MNRTSKILSFDFLAIGPNNKYKKDSEKSFYPIYHGEFRNK